MHKLHTIKKGFPRLLEESYGIISIACRKAGIERRTYYNWRNKDPGFAKACDEVLDTTADFVEAALIKKIDEGDVAAIIFYCKTKLKYRGYTERIEKVQIESPPAYNLTEHDNEIIEGAIQRRIAEMQAMQPKS